MTARLVMLICLFVGYLLGSVAPLDSLFYTRRHVRFKSDYLVKAGTEASTRESSIITVIPNFEVVSQSLLTTFPEFEDREQ